MLRQIMPGVRRTRSKALANFDLFNLGGLTSKPHSTNNLTQLNLVEKGNSSLCFKAEVSLPWM